jgi:hypothetical protein
MGKWANFMDKKNPRDPSPNVNWVEGNMHQALPENDVCLYLKDVKEQFFSKYDWVFLNDKMLFISTEGIGMFVAKKVRTTYSEILGKDKASALIKRIMDLRGKKISTLSDQDIVNILAVDKKNMEMLYSDVDIVKLERKFLRGYRLTIISESMKRIADIAWNRVSYRRLALFFKARVGSRFLDR